MNNVIKASFRALLALAFLAITAPVLAQTPFASFTRTDVMIPMRDGVRLHTQVYAPANADEKLPILLLRTTYGIGDTTPAQLAAAIPEFSAEGSVDDRDAI